MNNLFSSRRTRDLLGVLVVFLLAACSGSPAGQADGSASLILRGGNVITMDDTNPRAAAVVIADDRIVYVGSDDGADAWRGSETRVVDLAGATWRPRSTRASASSSWTLTRRA